MVLKNIPVFTMNSMTQLRRFITLVDELYQYKVKLICTTEAPRCLCCIPGLWGPTGA